ncbi:MAG: HAMP domain-containing sensor histidine kinase [Patescibacteria group bacterium]
MFRVFKNSIFGKIFGSLILTLFLSGVFFIFVSLKQQGARITENLIKRSETLSKIASKQIEKAYYAEVWPFETLKLIISESEDIVFLWVAKPDGRIYFSDDPDVISMGKIIKEPFLGTEETLIQDWTYPRGVEKIKLIIQPLEIRDEEGRPWSLLMGVSLRSVVAAERTVIFNSLGLFILTFFLAIFISFYLTKKITSPLEKLKQGAEIIGKGNLDYQIEIKTRDEVGKLAEAFNKMTEDLKNSQMALGEELKRAKELDRMKTEFISIAAHQLRTPLTAVKWILKMIINGDLGELTSEQKAFLSRGYQGNERTIKLVNDFLNVSRIEEGRFGYVFELIQLEDLIDNLIQDFDHVIKERQVDFIFEKPKEPLPKVKIDHSKMRLAIQNLIDNAIKYTPEKGRVAISIKNSIMHLEVTIKDTGYGIPKKQHERIFTKFFRGDNVIRKQVEGTGLGLFIVKNIIEKHGGTIWFESEENKGTTFYFTIPVST